MTGISKRILVLGAGRVARPLVRYFLDRPGYRVTVASIALDEARALVAEHSRGVACDADVSDPEQLDPLIAATDLVVSLLPFALHPQVARCAIQNRVHMVTTSYVSPEMRTLDDGAREAGVTILNEIGLDPGIDHMSAMRMIDRVRADGERLVGFTSCCGGLPSPEAADNPWRYKFSWSPRGALLAGRLSARYLDRGRVVFVPGDHLFRHAAPYEIEGLGTFEMYPNRDSLSYIDAYDIRDVRSMLRGTLRYPGWSETMAALSDLGLLDVEPRQLPERMTYADFLGTFLPPKDGPVATRLARRLSIEPDHPIVERLRWAGLLSDEPLGEREASPLDVLARRFEKKMAYRDGERDMVVLRHEIEVHAANRTERRVSLLTAYGDPAGDSAIARTVSLPAAVGARLLLEGRIELPGVRIPTCPELYEPILDELASLGIAFREWAEGAAGT